ncbi:TetR/AcrR family transcriptional regulator [Amycolatopsis ultiminotia]|uniref:TetR/AcrR family transcriptional regulator n=1 Tax=Amycolatopsis ultiminotia TaxID=543629 RepID=A0ABP6V1A6_9PSEU
MLDAARDAVAEGRSLSFNDLAREADVGVGTVYRHFASAEALRAALAADSLDDLLDVGRRALGMPEPLEALATFLKSALTAQLKDDALAQIVETDNDVDPRTSEVKAKLRSTFTTLVDSAAATGALRSGVSADHLVAMLCGVSHAARLHPREQAPAAADQFLTILLAGLASPPDGRSR